MKALNRILLDGLNYAAEQLFSIEFIEDWKTVEKQVLDIGKCTFFKSRE